VRRLSAVMLVLALTLTGCGARAATTRISDLSSPTTHARPGVRHVSSPSGSGVSPGAAGSVGSTAGSAKGKRGAGKIRHVVWIWFENEDQSNIIGNHCCTYFTRLAKEYGNATNYYALGHYSADNYTGATGGIPCCYDDSYRQLSNRSIFNQLRNGQSRSLEESMPSPCDTRSSGEYAVRHNPEAYYAGTLGPDCARYDIPYKTGSRPNLSAKFTFVTPNLCHDAHDCSTATADRWLASEMPLFMNTRQYKSGTTVIFVTFDEGSSNVSQGPTSPPNNRIPMIVVSPMSSGQDGTRWTHYSLLATTEQIFGLPKLGGAASATTMCGHFGLTC
jgi:phosphatidylinositol-3-phosphatase